MPSRKLVHPSSNRKDRRSEPKRQTVFNDVYEDEPASILPDGAVAKTINAWCDGGRVRPRNGSILWTKTPMPAIPGRTGYIAHKDGYYIISDSGDIFNKTDVSNLWVWEDGLSDEIVEWISPQKVKVRDNDPNSGNGYIRGKINLCEWHRKKEHWILQLGEDFWKANREMTTFTLILIVSRDKPSNSFSEYREFNDDALINNSGGLFKIVLDDNPPTAYRLNSDIPNERIESNQDEGDKNHKYRYFYAAERLKSTELFNSRNTPVEILTESGLNKYFYEDESEVIGDWATVNTDDPVGPGEDTYGVLYSGPSLVVNPAAWALLDDATVRFNINNLGYANIVFDFTDVVTMDDVADVIQRGLKRYFPSATCEYVGDRGRPRLKITSGRVAGGNVSYCLPGVGGSDNADNLGLRETDGAIKINPKLNERKIIRGLKVPPVGLTGDLQWHWTHFAVYRSADIGPSGQRIKTNGKATVNSPDYIVWVKDLRVAGSFIARLRSGVVELYEEESGGQFEKADEGATVEFEDGTRVTLIHNGYIDSKHCRYSGSGQYYYESTDWQAAMIGNGRVARVSKSGTRVTVYPGSTGTTFTSSDERKPILFPNGVYSFIKEVKSSTEIEVWDDRNWDMTAITLDPTYRNFSDAVADDTLYGYSAAWTAKNRFFTPIRQSDTISIQPGFLLTAPRYGKEINYCQLELSYRQFVGYHNQDYQRLIIDDQIMALEDFPNRFSVLCKGSIHTGVTNNAIEITIEGTLQKIFQLADVEKVADFGISDAGSIQRIGEGMIRMITNIDEIRDFDGINYGDDLAVNNSLNLKKIQNVVQNAYPQFCSLYSRITGYLFWWKK